MCVYVCELGVGDYRVKKISLGIKKDGMGGIILNRAVMTSLIELVTFKLGKSTILLAWWKVLEEEETEWKIPCSGIMSYCLRNNGEAKMPGAD